MNNLERLDLIDRIARDLQSRMGYRDIDVYLGGHGVDTKRSTSGVNSKWVYAKELLAEEPVERIVRIATELQVPHKFVVTPAGIQTESTFWESGYFRLFLSHLSTFKKETALLQKALRPYGISAFVAHVDIEPTREWMREIELALMSMDAMAAIVMPGFKESNWTDQEVGVAIGRNVLVVPVLRGMDPYGFLGKYQGLRAEGKTVGQVGLALSTIIGKSERTQARLVSVLTALIASGKDEAEAIQRLKFLLSLGISQAAASQLREVVSQNDILRSSGPVRASANSILRSHKLPEIDAAKPSNPSIDEWDDDLPF
jgi:hypothetical protein